MGHVFVIFYFFAKEFSLPCANRAIIHCYFDFFSAQIVLRFFFKEDYYYVVLNLLLHVENNNILRIEPCQSQGSNHLQQWSPTKLKQPNFETSNFNTQKSNFVPIRKQLLVSSLMHKFNSTLQIWKHDFKINRKRIINAPS